MHPLSSPFNISLFLIGWNLSPFVSQLILNAWWFCVDFQHRILAHPSSPFWIHSSPLSNVKLSAVRPYPLCSSPRCFAKVTCSPFFIQKLPHTSRWGAQLWAPPGNLSWILSTSYTLFPDGLSVFPPTVPNTWRQPSKWAAVWNLQIYVSFVRHNGHDYASPFIFISPDPADCLNYYLISVWSKWCPFNSPTWIQVLGGRQNRTDSDRI